MNKFYRYIIWASVITFVIVLLLAVFDKAYLVFDKVIYPVQHFFYSKSVGLRDFYANIDKYKNFEEENKRLLEKNIQLELMNTQLKETKTENDFLREQLNYLEETDYQYHIAKVIGKSSSNYEHILFIDKGSLDGVRVGDPAIMTIGNENPDSKSEGVLIGKVYETYKTYSMVLLLVDNNSATAVSIQNSDKTLGVVNGEYGLSMKMDYIPQTEALNIGDKVISSGLERFVPRGLLLGTIDSINYEQGELFKSAVVKPLINYDKIILLTILHVQEE